jgi:hypothetical protein
LLERIGDSENSGERSTLFKETSTQLMAHAKAEQKLSLQPHGELAQCRPGRESGPSARGHDWEVAWR